MPICNKKWPALHETRAASQGGAGLNCQARQRTAPGQKHDLEREIHTAAEHSKIILWPIDHAEAQVVSPSDVLRDSEFETRPELADQFGFATEMIRLRMDSERVRWPLCVKDIPFATAENRADTSPGVGCKTCARNRIAQCKRS